MKRPLTEALSDNGHIVAVGLAIVIFTIGTLFVWKVAGPAIDALAQWSVK